MIVDKLTPSAIVVQNLSFAPHEKNWIISEMCKERFLENWEFQM